jgi:23S rRNA (guanosine2251-2'-O)-methyltransferase
MKQRASNGGGRGEGRGGGKKPFGKAGPKSFGKRGDTRPRGERPAREAPLREAPLREGFDARVSQAMAEDGRFTWGVNPVLEILRTRPQEIERLFFQAGAVNESVAGELFTRARSAKVRYDEVPRDRLDRMAGGAVHQGVVAEVRSYNYLELDRLIGKATSPGAVPLLVVLDGIQDPHNLGAIIRSAHAFGAAGVIIGKDRAAAVTGTVAKVAAGALVHMPVTRVTNISRTLEELKAKGFWTIAAESKGELPLWSAKLTGPLAIVIGAEGDGIRDGVLKQCDHRVRIPMAAQFDSLNASVSASVLLYELARQRAYTAPVSAVAAPPS